jgi:putative molybdopterin biosynthesis protein
MGTLKKLDAFDQVKALADSRRSAILRKLMVTPATLSQLGRAFGEHPAWIRHHLKQLERTGLVEMTEVRVTGSIREKYYRACADALLLQELILPASKKPTVIFSGSHDLAIELLAEDLSRHVNIVSIPIGSLNGLVTLREGLSHLAGCHLLDETGEYNIPFIQHIFPDRPTSLVTLAHREQGLMIAAGNPKSICTLVDLIRTDVLFINRNAGSGTRLWLDMQLHAQNIPAGKIRGYERSASTHSEAARTIQEGNADAAIGLRAAAHRHGLDFIPLFNERYDLAFPVENEKTVAPLLDTLQTSASRQRIESLAGYETTHTGERILL